MSLEMPPGPPMGPSPGGQEQMPPEMQQMPPMQEPPESQAPPPEPDWSRLADDAMVRDIRWSEEEEKLVKAQIRQNIERSVRGLQPRNDDIALYRKMYQEDRSDRTPMFKGGSNAVMPATAPDTDQITARTDRVANATDPPFVVLPAEDQEIPYDELYSVQKYMKAKISDPRMEFDRARLEFIHEAVLTGVGVAKVKWDTKTRSVCTYKFAPDVLPLGGEVKSTPRVVHDDVVWYEGNTFEVVKWEDFYYPPEVHTDPNLISNAQWVAHRFPERIPEIRRKANAGIYRKAVVPRILAFDARREIHSEYPAILNQDAAREMDVQSGVLDKSGAILTCYEVWGRFTFTDKEDGAQEEKDCVIVYCYEADEILSAKYNFFFHGQRPFVRAPFGETGEFCGRGVAKRLIHVQKLLNDLVNIGIDAGKYATLKPLVKRKDNSIARGKNDKLMPGVVFEVDDVDQIKLLEIGDTSPSTFQFLPLIQEAGRQATGVSGLLVGAEGEKGNRETAAGAGQRIGNSAPLFDMLLDCVRRALEKAAELMFWNCWQFKPDGDSYLEQDENGAYVSKLFKMPPDAGLRYRFRITASSVAANPEIRKQTVQHLMGLLDPAEQQLMQVAGQISDPNTPPMLREMMLQSAKRKTVLLKQLTESFDMPGASRLVPDFEQIWAENEGQVMQAVQAAQQQPKPIEDTVMRAIISNLAVVPEEIQAQFWERLGFKVPPDLQARINAMNPQQPGGENAGNPEAGGPMGGPEAGGAGGATPPPQPM